MGRANPATCEHPVRKHQTSPSFGHTLCTRCDTDLTPASRLFTVRTGERTTFTQGDRVHVKAHGANPSYKGVFQWAEEWPYPGGSYFVFVVCEKQAYKPEGSKQWHEGTAAVRHVAAEYVRHDNGLRQRRQREEELENA